MSNIPKKPKLRKGGRRHSPPSGNSFDRLEAGTDNSVTETLRSISDIPLIYAWPSVRNAAFSSPANVVAEAYFHRFASDRLGTPAI
jgi:hypothetical protein